MLERNDTTFAMCDHQAILNLLQHFYKSWDLFVNLFQKEKVLCCSSISKGKTGAPAVLTGISRHKTKKKKISDKS